MRILIADDSALIREGLRLILTDAGHEVVAGVGDGVSLVREALLTRPDVVITDVEMPGMDGFELTRHIRADPRTAHLPVIMITAADDRHREHAASVGVSVLLGKPYPEDLLIAHIRRALRQDDAAPAAAAELQDALA